MILERDCRAANWFDNPKKQAKIKSILAKYGLSLEAIVARCYSMKHSVLDRLHRLRNALRSTGPRTPSGKARSRANSVRHGLLSKAMADPALVARAQKLAIRIARAHGQPDQCVEAHTVAEAELTMLQVRAIRTRLLNVSSAQGAASGAASDQHHSHEAGDATRAVSITNRSDLASAYLHLLPMLSRLDRYEKTAALRRQRALRNLCPLK